MTRYKTVLIVLFLSCTKLCIDCQLKIKESNEETISIYDKSMINIDNINAPFTDNFGDKGESAETSEQLLSLDTTILNEGNITLQFVEFEKCVLENSEHYLSWWLHENGSLKVPARNSISDNGFLDLSMNFKSEDALLEILITLNSQQPSHVIRALSMANNKLTNVPKAVLHVTGSLEYLSLANNNFYELFESFNTTFEDLSTFPYMLFLRELDLRNCQMTKLKPSYFKNLISLVKLFISQNIFTVIRAEDFSYLSHLLHLDISRNQLYHNYSKGLYLEREMLQKLPNLQFLDLSHTKLTSNSSETFKYLGKNMKQISLCYTNLQTLDKETFDQTKISVIDLSGNSELYLNLTPHHLQYVEDTLEVFVYRNASISDKKLFTYLKNLKMLDLKHNQINSLMPFDFSLLQELKILDLENNLVTNWYYRVLSENKKLMVVNLSRNKLTMITQEMLLDFYEIDYLAIGWNKFTDCTCSIRDFIDRAKWNMLYQHCPTRSKMSIDFPNMIDTPLNQYNAFFRKMTSIIEQYEEIKTNILKSNSKTVTKSFSAELFDCSSQLTSMEFNMNFNFVLLDFDQDAYRCNDIEKYGREYISIPFNEIQPCLLTGSTISPGAENSELDGLVESTSSVDVSTDSIPGESSNEFGYLYLLYTLLLLPLVILAYFLFHNRNEILYFFSLFKNSLILSLDVDDKKNLIYSNRKSSINSADKFVYDVFVSYSDNDRSWVLDELIPNIESCSNLSVCLHERDFQVGLSILENIIQCMDKSRCLLLIISESFLKSNWCSFEMHLAQHRLIETRREQLILVLLQDIPRRQQTRTLRFLMRTKTYIAWSNDGNKESQKIFWKRLRKAILLSDKNSESKFISTKQRHSIV